MPTKKSSAKRSTSKKPVAKKHAVVKQQPMRSFRLVKSDTPFMTIRVNRETLYWLILGAIMITFTLWITNVQSDVQAIYDQLEINNATDYQNTPRVK